MAYVKTNWKDRVVERPNTYTMTNNGNGTVTLTPVPGQIIERGTPLNAENLNKIEDAIVETNAQLSHLETTTEGFVNIKSYAHLVVDNDWSDALIQALNEHPNIYIPAGEYEISKTIKIINNKRIVGGADIYSTSIISKLQSGTLFDITYSAYGSSSISNLFIENKGGETVNGVVLNDNEVSGRTPFGFFGNNLDIRGFYHNLYLRGMCTYTTFTRCFFSKAKKLNLYVVSGFVNTFDKCRFSSSESGVSVRVRAGEQNFVHCAFEGAAKGLDITPNGGKVGIDGCFFEYLGDESSTLLNVNSPNDNFTALNVLNVRNTHFYGGDVSIYLNGVKHANLDGNSLREVKDRNVVYPTNNPNASLWVFNGNLYDVAINTDASYIVGDDLPAKITVSNTLPRADESQNGRFFIFETGTYQELRVCMKYPAGNYGWAKVFTTESASVIEI